MKNNLDNEFESIDREINWLFKKFTTLFAITAGIFVVSTVGIFFLIKWIFF